MRVEWLIDKVTVSNYMYRVPSGRAIRISTISYIARPLAAFFSLCQAFRLMFRHPFMQDRQVGDPMSSPNLSCHRYVLVKMKEEEEGP